MKHLLCLSVLGLVLGALAPNPARGDFFGELQPKLIQAASGKAAPAAKPEVAPKYVAVYYSAHWCPPCRAFTPKLVEWYKAFQPQHKDFQLIFVSSDRDEKAMLQYMTEMQMPWLAVKFAERRASGLGQYATSGIPYLVLLDASGKDLTGDGNKKWQSPQGTLEKIEKIVGAGK